MQQSDRATLDNSKASMPLSCKHAVDMAWAGHERCKATAGAHSCQRTSTSLPAGRLEVRVAAVASVASAAALCTSIVCNLHHLPLLCGSTGCCRSARLTTTQQSTVRQGMPAYAGENSDASVLCCCQWQQCIAGYRWGSLNLNTETSQFSALQPNLQNRSAMEKDRYKVQLGLAGHNGHSPEQ